MMGYKLSCVNLLFKKISGNVNQLQSKTLRMTIVNPIALRRAKLHTVLAFLCAIGLKNVPIFPSFCGDREEGEDVSISPSHLPKLYRLFCNISAGSADLTRMIKCFELLEQ